jgi:hypothetical protein
MAEAEARARTTLADAEARARALTEETERHLREDISRLESIRTQLAGDVETIARHLDTERNRLRAALGDMLTWVDEHVQPAASLLAQPTVSPSPSVNPASVNPASGGPTPSGGATPGGATPGDSSTGTKGDTEGRGPVGTPAMPRPMPSGQTSPGGPSPSSGPRTSDSETSSPGERQGMMPLADPEGARAGVPH